MTAAALAATAAIVSAATSAAAAGYSAYSQNKQGREQQKLADHNAKLQEIEARNAEAETQAAVSAQQRENARQASRQRALFASAGVNVGAGTPLIVQGQQAAEGSAMVGDIARQGAITASRYRQQGNIYRAQGQVSRTAGRRAAAGTLLGGASKVANTGFTYALNK